MPEIDTPTVPPDPDGDTLNGGRPTVALTATATDPRDGMTLDELATYLNDTRAAGVPGNAYARITARRGRIRTLTASGPWVTASRGPWDAA